MDQELLVREAQTLTQALDETKISPKAVIIALSPETGNWKLWIVPNDDAINKQEFYRIIAENVSGTGMQNIDVGSVELYSSKNPSIVGLSQFIKMDGIGSAHMSNNTYNGILLPDGIIIRMSI